MVLFLYTPPDTLLSFTPKRAVFFTKSTYAQALFFFLSAHTLFFSLTNLLSHTQHLIEHYSFFPTQRITLFHFPARTWRHYSFFYHATHTVLFHNTHTTTSSSFFLSHTMKHFSFLNTLILGDCGFDKSSFFFDEKLVSCGGVADATDVCYVYI